MHHLLRAKQGLVQGHCNSQHEHRVYAWQGMQGVGVNVARDWSSSPYILLDLVELSNRLSVPIFLQWQAELQGTIWLC